MEKKWSCLKMILCFLEKPTRGIGRVKCRDHARHAGSCAGFCLPIYLRAKDTTSKE